MIQTGDGFGYSGITKLAKIIQKEQAKEHLPSAFLSHTGIYVWQYVLEFPVLHVLEATFLQDYKIKAAVQLTPFKEYLQTGGILYQFPRVEEIEYPVEYAKALTYYTGYPYELKNLLRDQLWLKWFGIWIGRQRNADKKLICHELTMTVENKYVELLCAELIRKESFKDLVSVPYPDARKGQVKNIYNSRLYGEIIELDKKELSKIIV